MKINITCEVGKPLLVNGVEATPAIMNAHSRLHIAEEAARAAGTALDAVVQRYEFELQNELDAQGIRESKQQ